MRRVRRENPEARVIVTGCYAQRAPGEVAALPGVDAVIGNSHKADVATVALRWAAAPRAAADFVPIAAVLHDDSFAHAELAVLPFAPDSTQTRPNLKVQDGCANRCSFCIIPTTRGPSRSLPLEACLDSVRRFVERRGQEGAGMELVLSGINLGRWGRDLEPPQRFEELVEAILSRTSLPRLRLSSIEPMDWSADLLALYRQFAAEPRAERPAGSADRNAERRTPNAAFHPRLARHSHLPLQSGSDSILRRMHRRYRPWHYAERLAQIRALLPDAAIGADVMTGFPGETDALFQESYDFIAAQPFTYLHLFPFSARPGTPAWELHRQNPVPARAVRERMQALRNLIDGKSKAFRSRFPGRTLSAVTIGDDAEQALDRKHHGSANSPAPGATAQAVTDNFLKLTLDAAGGERIAANRLIEARITGLTPDGLRATLHPA